MEKTKLGISVGVMGGLLYLAAMFSNFSYLVVLFAVGYVLFAESNAWLRCTAVQALALVILCDAAIYLIDFIPELLNLVRNLLGVFKTSFDRIPYFEPLLDFLANLIGFAQKVVFILLGVMALGQRAPVLTPFTKLVK